MKSKKVSINIVTWNSITYLPDCLKSIFDQSFKDFQVLVIDNGSNDGTVDYIEKNYPEVKILRNIHNLGYSRAHNQGLKLSKSDYILIMNPDVILTKNYLFELYKNAEKMKVYSAFTGKIYKFHFKIDELKEIVFTDIIDSVGIKVDRNRNFINLGENEKDTGQFKEKKDVFGISGGLLFLRKKDVELLNINNEYFDEDFFVYKEDIDLAWRMNINGLKSVFIPEAFAYHHRQADQTEVKNIKSIRKNRRKKSNMINYYSTRNHFFLMVKNDFLKNYFKDFLFITWRELKRFFYILLFEFSSLKSYLNFFKLLPKMIKKRKMILKDKKSANNFRKWLS